MNEVEKTMDYVSNNEETRNCDMSVIDHDFAIDDYHDIRDAYYEAKSNYMV